MLLAWLAAILRRCIVLSLFDWSSIKVSTICNYTEQFWLLRYRRNENWTMKETNITIRNGSHHVWMSFIKKVQDNKNVLLGLERGQYCQPRNSTAVRIMVVLWTELEVRIGEVSLMLEVTACYVSKRLYRAWIPHVLVNGLVETIKLSILTHFLSYNVFETLEERYHWIFYQRESKTWWVFWHFSTTRQLKLEKFAQVFQIAIHFHCSHRKPEIQL